MTSITIPESVTSIGKGTFAHCSSLTSITIPGGVTSIGDEAFSVCSSLTSITIPESVTSIGDDLFEDCRNLKSIYCKAVTPPAICQHTFSSCIASVKIYVPTESVEAYKVAGGWMSYADYIVGYDFE